MSSYTINFNSKKDKRHLFNHLKMLKGIVQVTTRKVRSYNGRYKYYWAYLLPIIEEAGVFYNEDAELLDKTQIHEALKAKYNPIIVMAANNKIIIQGQSTTKLSDDKFIGEYEDRIFADFQNEPYNCNFEYTRYEWTQMKIDEKDP